MIGASVVSNFIYLHPVAKLKKKGDNIIFGVLN
jgi:hypothetical protein